ncbi:MAG: 3'-5' exonuclease [Cytophagales bacterium]|nr:3'-5' exonuclease [Cytophagales bacterium]
MNPQLFNILFIDIETTAGFRDFSELPDRMKPLWERKAAYLKNEKELSGAEMYSERAAIYAEFGKVICIGVGGYFINKEGKLDFKTKTLSSHSEAELLTEFSEILEKHKAKEYLKLCAHNGKEFDFPYLSRRMLINNLPLPYVLDLAGKKPWEVNHIDTMELWKFGDYKHYTSLDLLAAVFDIPSSKSDISGADVNRVYYEENNLEKIADYCERDVKVLAELYLKLKGEKS